MVAVAAVLAAPSVGFAQKQTAKIARVGWLEWTESGRYSEVTSRAFIEGLSAAGYVEGKNLVLERRVALGDLRRLAEQARELAALKVDVLFTPSKATADAAWYASRAIPTVIATVTDPVAVEYARSLARPGKHITGVTTASAELTGKRLELLREAVSGATRIAVLYDKTLYDSCQQELKQFRAAATKLGVTLLEFAPPNLAIDSSGLDQVFRKMVDAKAQALIMPLFTSLSDSTPEIVRLAFKYRLATMHEFSDFAEAGGLMTYGPDYADVYRRAAHYVARILKGEQPAAMAIEEPRLFKLTVNLKTARALGLTIPQSILLRADSVIE